MHIKLDENNFSDASVAKLQKEMKNNNAVVLLHAEWCYWCKQFLPEWQQFVETRKKDPSFTIADIESSSLGKIQSDKKYKSLYDTLVGGDEGVGFPTVMLFKKGNKFTYKGERSSAALNSHIDSIIPQKPKSKVPKKSAKPKPKASRTKKST